MKIGNDNRKQVYILAALTVLLVGIAGWDFLGTSSTEAAVLKAPARTSANAIHHREAGKAASGGDLSEPKLRLAQLGDTESTDYSSSSRNIFSVVAHPVVIEEPIAPPRPEAPVAVLPPQPPAIEVKYLGYTRNVGELAYKAVLAYKDESLIAVTGDIVFHRYKVGSIQPASLQITDLNYKDTQSLPIIDK
jgi:hypothetical protein